MQVMYTTAAHTISPVKKLQLSPRLLFLTHDDSAHQIL